MFSNKSFDNSNADGEDYDDVAASIRIFDKLEMQFVKNFIEDGANWGLYEITAYDY